MNTKPKSNKDRAFELFDQGCNASSPEVKALKIVMHTRHDYYRLWRIRQETQTGGSVSEEIPTKSTRTSRKKTPLPGGESLSSIDARGRSPSSKAEVRESKPSETVEASGVESEDSVIESELEEEPEDIEDEPAEIIEPTGEDDEPEPTSEEAKTKEEEKATPSIKPVNVSKIGKDGKKGLPRDITGQGITVTVEISVKTLALYQIAANMTEEELTLGDFLDSAAEDMFQVRGKDLGLVPIRRE